MRNNGQTFPPGLLQDQLFQGNRWFTNDFGQMCLPFYVISLPLFLCGWPKQACVFIWAHVAHPKGEWESNLCYDFICNACRAICGPVNESCRLSCSDANCTRPLKSSLPSVLVYLPPQQKKSDECDKRGEKCCTQAETIIKPRTLLCQRGEREDKPSLCAPRSPSLFCLTPSYPLWNRPYPQIPPWQGHKKWEFVAYI